MCYGHNFRQKYIVGKLKSNSNVFKLKKYLFTKGFEKDYLAWKDPGEILSLRKVDLNNPKFQYHIRLFKDNEIRGHYEYSPEGSPYGHIIEKEFRPETLYFKKLLKEFLARK